MSFSSAVIESVFIGSIVTFTFAGDMSALLAELAAVGCTECDDDGDTVWGLDFDGSDFRIRPQFSA